MEEDTLTRLHSLKVINQGLAVLREQQSASYNEANVALSEMQADNERQIEEHNTEGLSGQLAELEEVLSQLRLEVEEVSAQNEATQLDSSKQTRAIRNIQVDRFPLVALSAQMKDLDSKSLEAKDKERDSTIDIYQLAMTYQRKVEEFESLLTDYAGDSEGLTSQVNALKIELQTL